MMGHRWTERDIFVGVIWARLRGWQIIASLFLFDFVGQL